MTLETLLLLSFVAGLVGAMAGMGEGVVLIPALTLAGEDIKHAIAVSTVSVIATSSGAASAYVRDHVTNLRVGMFLAIVGGMLAGGVVTSLTLIIAGLAWHRLATGVATFDAPLGGTDALRLLTGDLRLAVAGRLSPRLLVSLGIAVLLFTPYLRVLASVVFFAAVEHDWKYTLFTGFVLAVLTYSLVTR